MSKEDMRLLDAARRRYPPSELVEDYDEQHYVNDSYGYDECQQQAFIEGAKWARENLQPEVVRETAKKAAQIARGGIDPAFDREMGASWQRGHVADRILAAFGMTSDDKPVQAPRVCVVFHWIGQPFTSCDRCGKPFWEHTYQRGAGDNAGNLELLTKELKAAAKAKWAPEEKS